MRAHVTVAQFGDLLLYLPLYIARSDSIFARHGLDVDIVSTGGDDKTYAAVISGSAEFGVADPTFVAIARERGQQGRVVALLIDGVPNFGVAATTRAPTIARPADLAGKTVATVPAPSTAFALVSRLFSSAGLRPSIYQVAPSGLVPALQTGRADYALLIEPWVSELVARGGTVAFSLMEYYPHFALTGVTASEEFIRTRPDVVDRMAASLTEAVGVFYQDDSVTFNVARRQFPSEADSVLRAAIQRHRASRIYPHCLTMTEAAWGPAVRLRVETGDLRDTPQHMSVYVDTVFTARSCSAQSGPAPR